MADLAQEAVYSVIGKGFFNYISVSSNYLKQTSQLGKSRPVVSPAFIVQHDMRAERTDRQKGHRGAYEKARAKILATQTTCGICGRPVDKSIPPPHPLSPTIDHIIPVSKGGHPSDLSNLQLAHRCCNRQKSDKLRPTKEAKVEEAISNRNLPLSLDWTQYRPS